MLSSSALTGCSSVLAASTGSAIASETSMLSRRPPCIIYDENSGVGFIVDLCVETGEVLHSTYSKSILEDIDKAAHVDYNTSDEMCLINSAYNLKSLFATKASHESSAKKLEKGSVGQGQPERQ
ncbi:hypothetical protein NliqN6_5056 [Naganishia liquefaciens]|uniref:Uncharacterized protein n=1 Tax=Naganishia liquefaciens TaxID=104408 RepID=A0A8H3TYR4_9TREE|nr:hypothetical protein NliqN6_5056 [Naganishia liquefaciens]